MRNDAPIVLTREEHLRHIASFWRQQEADRLRDEVLYDDVLRGVQLAMLEPQPRRDWSAARDIAAALAFNYAGIALGGLILWEMIR